MSRRWLQREPPSRFEPLGADTPLARAALVGVGLESETPVRRAHGEAESDDQLLDDEQTPTQQQHPALLAHQPVVLHPQHQLHAAETAALDDLEGMRVQVAMDLAAYVADLAKDRWMFEAPRHAPDRASIGARRPWRLPGSRAAEGGIGLEL
ncbi:hypothetical protein HK105_201555 [Polyrhizophydium stewartii]|uniref:Uncharacterized protein n=1 Tax=Polyrhizophydium stewartii TaxID=2732419 RepID=A0ABR4NGX7_9FUNG